MSTVTGCPVTVVEPFKLGEQLGPVDRFTAINAFVRSLSDVTPGLLEEAGVIVLADRDTFGCDENVEAYIMANEENRQLLRLRYYNTNFQDRMFMYLEAEEVNPDNTGKHVSLGFSGNTVSTASYRTFLVDEEHGSEVKSDKWVCGEIYGGQNNRTARAMIAHDALSRFEDLIIELAPEIGIEIEVSDNLKAVRAEQWRQIEARCSDAKQLSAS